MKNKRNLIRLLALLVVPVIFIVVMRPDQNRLKIIPPTLIGSSDRPVLLRHKWKKGERVAASLTVDTQINTKVGQKTNSAFLSMSLSFIWKATAIDKQKNINITMRITRVTIKGGDPATKSIDFDSARNRYNMNKYLRTTLYKITISPLGKIFKSDTWPRAQKLQIGANYISVSPVNSLVYFVMNLAIDNLPAENVKVGSEYKDPASIIVDSGIKFIATAGTAVRSIAMNKNRVVLVKRGVLELAKDKTRLKRRIEDGQLAGWALFDCEKGRVVKAMKISKYRAHTFMGTEPAVVDYKMKSLYKVEQ